MVCGILINVNGYKAYSFVYIASNRRIRKCRKDLQRKTGSFFKVKSLVGRKLIWID